MTEQEKIIATGFTGINFGCGANGFVTDASKRLNRKLSPRDILDSLAEIKEAYREDFFKMCHDETE
jgi:hypothetical protein